MPRVTYIQPDGTPKVVDASPGTTLMEAAVDNGASGWHSIVVMVR